MFDLRSLQRPTTLDQALDALATDPQSSIIAGGSDVLVKLRDGKLGGRSWVSLQALDELRGVSLDEAGTLRIGALSTFTQVAGDATVRRLVNSLPEALLSIGGPQVRNIGTLGGNLCNGVPSADSASTCFAWDAELEIAHSTGRRRVPIADFYISAGRVALEHGEIVTAVVFPQDAYAGYAGASRKYAMRNAMDIATVNCAVTVKLSDDKTSVADARIAFGVAAPTPIRTPAAEAWLQGRPLTHATVDEAARMALGDTRARNSWRASKGFRLQMLYEMTRRCLVTAITRAGGTMEER